MPNAVRAIEALPWVLDGLTGDEPYYKRRLETYTWNPEYSEPLALAVVAKPWVQDGLTSVEVWTIGPIFSFVGTHHPPTAKSCAPDCEPLALRLLDMPFLETIDAIDARAANSLQSLLHYDYPSVHEILSHPTLRDGITDDLAPVVSVLSSVFSGKLWVPQSLDYLLDPEQTSPQERVITLPHTGTVKLVGIIPGKTASDAEVSRAMDILEYSVRTQEEFMGAPFPDPQLVMSIFDRGYSDGGYVRSHINSSTVDEYVIAHEVGHAYFGTIIGNWINEGGANFLETITRTSLHNTSLPKALDSCGTVKTIAEIISIGQNDRKLFGCNYALGEGMFLDLYQNLGDEAFRQGFRDLHSMTFVHSYEDFDFDSLLYTGPHAGLSYIKAAFVTGATPENAAIAEEIINRRYYGTSP